MAQKGGGNTINSGPARKPKSDEFDIGGKARKRGQDPSPDDRSRGEISQREQHKSARQ